MHRRVAQEEVDAAQEPGRRQGHPEDVGEEPDEDDHAESPHRYGRLLLGDGDSCAAGRGGRGGDYRTFRAASLKKDAGSRTALTLDLHGSFRGGPDERHPREPQQRDPDDGAGADQQREAE